MQNYTIIDIITIVIILLGFLRGYRRGFINSVAGLIVYMGSMIAAKLASYQIATVLYNITIRPIVYGSVLSETTSIMEKAGIATLDGFDLSSFIPVISRAIPSIIQTDSITSSLATLGSVSFSEPEQLATYVSVNIAMPPIVSIMTNVFFVILFFVFIFAFRFILRSLNIITRIPGVGKLNRYAGGVLGALTSSSIIYLISKVFFIIISFNLDMLTNSLWIADGVIASTRIFSFFYYL